MDEIADEITKADHLTALTGAGISTGAGIPDFRGDKGIYRTGKYEPDKILDINYFVKDPTPFYDFATDFLAMLKNAKPTYAHLFLADLERRGKIDAVITQNIDGLHQKAGSTSVCEFHGNTDRLLCLACGRRENVSEKILSELPPECPACGGLLKPDFVFFGEPIPEDAHRTAFAEAAGSTAMIVVGTTGEVMPAAYVPRAAKEAGAFIIEVNTIESAFTRSVTDLFLRGRAGDVLGRLAAAVLDEPGPDPAAP